MGRGGDIAGREGAASRTAIGAIARRLAGLPDDADAADREEREIRHLSDPANIARIRRKLEAAIRQAAASARVDSSNLRPAYEMALLVKLGLASRPEARAEFERAWRESPDAPHVPFRTELIDGDLWRRLGRPKRRGWRLDEDQRPHRRYRFPWTQRALVHRDTGEAPRDIRELRGDLDPRRWKIIGVEHTTDEEPKAEHFVNWVPYTEEERDSDIARTLDAYGRPPDGPPRGFKPEDAFVSFAKGVDWPMYRAMGQTRFTVDPQHDALSHSLSGPAHDMKSVMRELVAILKRMEEGGDRDAPWVIAYMAHKRLGRVAAPAGLGRAARRVLRAAGAGIPPPELAPLGETPAESEVRARLRAGLMAGVAYRSVFRPVGSNRAVVEIMGQRFTIDDSGCRSRG